MLVSDRLKTPWSARQEAGLTVRPWWKCTYSKVGSPGITDPVRVRETGTRAILRGSLSLHCGWVGLERSHFHSKVGFELSSRHLRPCRWSNQGATQRPRRHHTWGPIWAALLLSFLWAIGNIQRMSTSFKMSILHTGGKHLVSEEFPWWLAVKSLPAKQESQVRSLGWEDPLEEGMATHSSILAWRILWTGEPGRLHYMGSQESDMTDATVHARLANWCLLRRPENKTIFTVEFRKAKYIHKLYL